MSRPERFDLSAARPLTDVAPEAPAPCPAGRQAPAACPACPDELRCPFRALARLIGG